MSENTVTHPALTALAALFNDAVIREPSGRRVCIGYRNAGHGAPVLCVQANRERPGQPPDTVLLPLDVTVTDFIEWAAELPAAAVLPRDAPIESDYIGAFLWGDIRAAVPELSETQCMEILDERRNALETALKAALRRFMRQSAQRDQWRTASAPDTPADLITELIAATAGYHDSADCRSEGRAPACELCQAIAHAETWLRTAPLPDSDPLHIGNIGLADIQDELPDLTIPQIYALLDEYQEDIEEQLGAECRRLLREFAAEMDWSAAAEDPDDAAA